jgi:hypothetical protein
MVLFMRKRWMASAIAAAFGFLAWISACPADAARDARRTRLVTLETLLAEKRASVTQSWARLAELEAQIQEWTVSDAQVLQNPDSRGADQAQVLLKHAEKREMAERERFLVLRQIAAWYGEMAALRQEAERTRAELQEDLQVLDGRWSLSLLPMGIKGDVILSQNGTLLTGDYRFDNGQAGSVQGTFVNNILVLERIDARYGRMGRLEGTLSRDRQSVKGSWYSYDVTSGQPLTGAFALDRPGEEGGP